MLSGIKLTVIIITSNFKVMHLSYGVLLCLGLSFPLAQGHWGFSHMEASGQAEKSKANLLQARCCRRKNLETPCP